MKKQNILYIQDTIDIKKIKTRMTKENSNIEKDPSIEKIGERNE